MRKMCCRTVKDITNAYPVCPLSNECGCEAFCTAHFKHNIRTADMLRYASPVLGDVLCDNDR